MRVGLNVDDVPRAGQVDVDDQLDAARAAGHHDDTVGEGNRLMQIMGDEDEGGFGFLPEFQQFLMHAKTKLGIEAAERFVHQEGVWFVGERAGDHHTRCQHPSGQLAGVGFLEAAKADLFQRALRADGDFGFRKAAEFQWQADVGFHRAPGQAVVLLGDVADVLVDAGDRLAPGR